MNAIYVIVQRVGEYDESTEQPVCWYDTLEAAEAEMLRLGPIDAGYAAMDARHARELEVEGRVREVFDRQLAERRAFWALHPEAGQRGEGYNIWTVEQGA